VADEREGHGDTPPEQPGEPLHHPTPTIFPAGFALGVALILLGLVINWWIVAIGAAIAIVFGFLWARDATVGYRKQAAPAPPAQAAATEDAGEEPERFPRDVFLERSTLLVGGLIGAAITIPVLGFAIAPVFIGQGSEDVTVGPLEKFPANKWIVTTFPSIKGEGDFAIQTAYIRNNGIANGVPSFTILSNSCAHLGCPVQPNGLTDLDKTEMIQTSSGEITLIPTLPAGFGCPCHGGQYDTEGNRTAGPPVRSLDRYEFKIVNGSLVLGGRYSVGSVEGTGADAQIKAFKRFDPGQHVDGWERILYPITPHQ
jgi:quinol---cytochrome c reductase iron-sulfur subunit, bacillus type